MICTLFYWEVIEMFLKSFLLSLLIIFALTGCESDEDKELKQEVKAINTHLEEQKNDALERERKRKARYEKLQKQAEQYRIQVEESR